MQNQPPALPQKPSAFSRLHRKLQEPLYRMGWTKIRQVQVDAIHEVFDGDGDLIISARTAAGKTEAAFLPILSRLVADEGQVGGVRAIYAGPLKALINDQFLRLERLCEYAEIPVHKWHGDVGPAARKRLFEKPAGVLLITPESIESLCINHPHKLARLFAGLDFFVIDEMHSFLGNERGAHLRSLIGRLARKSREPVRRIGLSATIGDPGAACRWLNPTDPEQVRLLEDKESKGIKLRLSGYLKPAKAQASRRSRSERAEDASTDRDPLLEDVFEAFGGKSALIFGNRKSEIERYADFLGREAKHRGMPNTFRVHHGSLSKGEREATEADLQSGNPIAAVCSSTLEMGIDVGSVGSVGQIGSPWSVNSLSQRLGRSGRKEGESSEIRIYVEEAEPGADALLLDRLFPELLQSIAMTELMLAKWCEPPDVDRLHLSTLVQQTLSVIAETGGARAESLHATLVAGGAFPAVDAETFVGLLRCLGKSDFVEQTPEGLLILGLLGEKIVRSRDFYMAFIVPEEYRVLHGGRHIGNVTSAPELGAETYLILAGRRWKILQVDQDRREILVEPSPGGRAPDFRCAAGHDIHPKVRETMRELLFRSDLPVYLDPTAKEMLTRARAAAEEADLAHRSFVQSGVQTVWFTWTGTRIQRTLYGLVAFFTKLEVADEDIALEFEKTTEEDVRHAYRGFLENCPDATLLASKFPSTTIEKYDPYLSEELRAQAFANHCLDLEGALRIIETL